MEYAGNMDDGGEGDAVSEKVTQLKKGLQGIVQEILAYEGGKVNFIELINRAQHILLELKGLILNPRSKSCLSTDSVPNFQLGMAWPAGLPIDSLAAVPREFRCPLSNELMRDPVILTSGLTYDKVFINNWLKDGNRTCPQTQEVLSHSLLTPNILIRELISQWCKINGIEWKYPVEYSEDEALTQADRQKFYILLGKLSSSLSDQKEAAKELRTLTKRMPTYRTKFGESPHFVPTLLFPILQSPSVANVEPELLEDIITTLLNISIPERNKQIVAENPSVLPILMSCLQSGTIQTRSNAAAVLFTLSAVDSNKALIGKSGALKPLIGVLYEGYPATVKDAASAIFNLCTINDNVKRAVSDGAVIVILRKMKNGVYVDELLAILALLSTNQTALDDIVEAGGIEYLRGLMREGTSSPKNKENCIAILYAICYNDESKWKELREEERTHGTISHLAQNGTSRAKRKATTILQRLKGA